MNSISILETVLEERARQLANDRLRDIANRFYAKSYEPTKLKFRNRALKKRWYLSLSRTIEKNLI